MKVIGIYFIKNCPGVPVYKVADGSLRLPFTMKTGQIVYFSKDEMLKGVSDQKVIFQNNQIFTEAEKQIAEADANYVGDVGKLGIDDSYKNYLKELLKDASTVSVAKS